MATRTTADAVMRRSARGARPASASPADEPGSSLIVEASSDGEQAGFRGARPRPTPPSHERVMLTKRPRGSPPRSVRRCAAAGPVRPSAATELRRRDSSSGRRTWSRTCRRESPGAPRPCPSKPVHAGLRASPSLSVRARVVPVHIVQDSAGTPARAMSGRECGSSSAGGD